MLSVAAAAAAVCEAPRFSSVLCTVHVLVSLCGRLAQTSHLLSRWASSTAPALAKRRGLIPTTLLSGKGIDQHWARDSGWPLLA